MAEEAIDIIKEKNLSSLFEQIWGRKGIPLVIRGRDAVIFGRIVFFGFFPEVIFDEKQEFLKWENGEKYEYNKLHYNTNENTLTLCYKHINARDFRNSDKTTLTWRMVDGFKLE